MGERERERERERETERERERDRERDLERECEIETERERERKGGSIDLKKTYKAELHLKFFLEDLLYWVVHRASELNVYNNS